MLGAVRWRIAQHDLPGAERLVRESQARDGASPELAAAISWLARGEFEARNLEKADAYAMEASKLAAQLAAGRKLDDDSYLPTAQGAAIEVHAQVLAARGERAEALEYLHAQSKAFAGTSLPERIAKNINLLTLEGKPAPALDEAEWLGSKPPTLAALHGHPVLLFFWAHWCPDCKALAPIVADLQHTFASAGLVVIGPTKRYGYAAGGDAATPDRERQYIEQVRGKYYGALAEVPVSAANFVKYGASTVPTLVLIDAAGIVRYYHPGAATETELAAKIQEVVRK